MIRPVTEKKDAIKRKMSGNARNRNRHTHPQATMIRPTKSIIKSRDAIRIKNTGKINRNLSNYTQK